MMPAKTLYQKHSLRLFAPQGFAGLSRLAPWYLRTHSTVISANGEKRHGLRTTNCLAFIDDFEAPSTAPRGLNAYSDSPIRTLAYSDCLPILNINARL